MWFSFEPPITLRWFRKLEIDFHWLSDTISFRQWKPSSKIRIDEKLFRRFLCHIRAHKSMFYIRISKVNNVIDTKNWPHWYWNGLNAMDLCIRQQTLTYFDAHTDCFAKVHAFSCFSGFWLAGSKFDVQLHPASILSIFQSNDFIPLRFIRYQILYAP